MLPSVFCMIRSTRIGYFVMRWVTNRKHSGIPNLRTRGSWPIFCYEKKGFVFPGLASLLRTTVTGLRSSIVVLFVGGIILSRNVITIVCWKAHLLETATAARGMHLIHVSFFFSQSLSVTREKSHHLHEPTNKHTSLTLIRICSFLLFCSCSL